ncbi:MAG: PilC/PilY family type IV pilus protein [Myxococcales bacterium]|nr:PilC/PilY family type IV pilus protein [Myxococcales bacterium]
MGAMKYLLLTIFGLGAVLALAPAAAAQTSNDLREILPYMMLVVDTSGSMERLPKCTCSSRSCIECLPKCDSTVLDQKKNRWAVTLEALTGTFNNFECEALDRADNFPGSYDVRYFTDYHQPWDCTSAGAGMACPPDSTTSTIDQNNNGILDQYKSAVRFGLMTFDGLATYVGSDLQIPASEFSRARSDSEKGLWSYGGPKSFHYPNCVTDYMMDTGARSPAAAAGSLVSLNSCTESSGSCPSWCSICSTPTPQSINDDIQKALLLARPYGGTPIAASLDDLYYHIKNDLTDLYGSCRDRYAMLITDGKPDADYRDLGCDCATTQDPTDPLYCGGPGNDPDSMKCPYPTPEQAAYDLVRGRSGDLPQLQQLFVVGLSINDLAVKDRLNAIALQGCPETTCDTDGDGNEAYFADNFGDLIGNLTRVIEAALKPISRSIPAVVDDPLGSPIKQYELGTGFNLPLADGDPWTGIIERRRFSCATGGFVQEPLDTTDKFHETLNAQLARDLWTAKWQPSIEPSGDAHLYRHASDTNAACGASGCAKIELKDAFVSPAVLGVATDPEKAAIMDWMYGQNGSVRERKRLGDVYHSDPVAVGSPAFDTADDSFNLFRARPEIRNRPLTLYVGSNDGILHAFSVKDYAGDATLGLKPYAAGEEMWGFVPPLLLNDLQTNLNIHQFTMDGTPVVKDVFFSRDKEAIASGLDYHTVLLTGMRGGGRAYVALDVTNPTAPEFMWQFTDDYMGLTYGQPAIGQVLVRWDGVEQERAVAILPGGQGRLGTAIDCNAGGLNDSKRNASTGTPYTSHDGIPPSAKKPMHRFNVPCWQDSKGGRSLYFVDVETGKLIRKMTADLATGTKAPFPSPLVSTPALYLGDVGTLVSRAFLTDADGVVWRIDMSHADPALWEAHPFHDLFWDASPLEGELSYEAPILSVDNAGQVVVIVGTGNTDSFSEPTAKNRVVSLTEVLDLDTVATGAERYVAAINWEMRVKDIAGFEVSEMVTGPMTLIDGILYFATFIPVANSGNACDLGKGRIFAVHYLNRDLGDPHVSPKDGVTTYGPIRSTEYGGDGDTTSVVNIDAASAPDNFMVMGVSFLQRPSCSDIQTVADPLTGQPYFIPGGDGSRQSFLVAHGVDDGAVSTLLQRRGGSAFDSLQLAVDRNAGLSRIMSWASTVE